MLTVRAGRPSDFSIRSVRLMSFAVQTEGSADRHLKSAADLLPRTGDTRQHGDSACGHSAVFGTLHAVIEANCRWSHRRIFQRQFHDDILHDGDFLTRNKFIGDGPSWTAGFHAETTLPVSAIHLHHYAIDFIGQLIPHRFRFAMKRHDVID